MARFENGTPEAPAMHEVACLTCPTRVLVRKNSLTQTSIQWLSDAGSCPELAARRAAGELTARVARCDALRASIDSAVVEGRLQVDA